MKRRSLMIAILGSICAAPARSAVRVAECWAGADPNGNDRWVPCQPATQGPENAAMTTLDLDGIRGVRVLYQGHAHEIAASEIWEALTLAWERRP